MKRLLRTLTGTQKYYCFIYTDLLRIGRTVRKRNGEKSIHVSYATPSVLYSNARYAEIWDGSKLLYRSDLYS